LNLLVGTFLTTAMLTLILGEKEQAVISSSHLAVLPLLKLFLINGALALLELVLILVWVVVAALLTLDPMAVSGSIPMLIGTVIILMLTLMLDFPLSKPLEEEVVASASKVLSTPRLLDLKVLSALSTLAVVQEPQLFLPLILVVSLLSALSKDLYLYLVMLALSTALIQLHTALLLDKRSALEGAWVKVPALMVSVFATKAIAVKTVL